MSLLGYYLLMSLQLTKTRNMHFYRNISLVIKGQSILAYSCNKCQLWQTNHTLTELVLSKASFTHMRFPIEMVSWPGNRIENDTVSKSLYGTYPIVKSKCLCQDNLILRPLPFVNCIWERVKSAYPCLPTILFICHGCGCQKKTSSTFSYNTIQ